MRQLFDLAPRRKRRVMMHVIDAGSNGTGKVILTAEITATGTMARLAEGHAKALERLGSSEAFHVSQPIDGPLAIELQMRLDFARSALSGKEQT